MLLVYIAAAFTVHVPWTQALKATMLPHISLSKNYMTALTAVFGTTISPYLFFWQASQEVEEQQADPEEKNFKVAPEQESLQLEPMRADTYLGMGISNVIAFFIILDTAASLHMHGVTDIQSATQAAESLMFLAVEFSFLLFSIGSVPDCWRFRFWRLPRPMRWPRP